MLSVNERVASANIRIDGTNDRLEIRLGGYR